MSKQTIDPLPESTVQTILFTHYGDDWIRGSERCLLDLIKHLDKSKFKALLWCNQPTMVAAAKDLDIEVYCSDFPILFGWQAPRFHITGFVDLIKEALALIKAHDVKLLHANSAAPCQWLTFASQQSNIPLICHMHSTYQLRDRLTLGLYQTNMLVGVSKYVVKPLVNDNKPKNEITVIPNGIDTERLLNQPVVNLREQLAINEQDFVLACLGSLIHRKGVDLLIESIAQLIKKELPVHLLVIGDGPEKEHLATQIAQLGLQENVSLLGECHDAVGILRGTADLFVSAAREEAFGLVFAEASLAGLAIVAPKTGGIPNIVIDQVSGLLVPTEDVNALVNSIEKLYLNPSLREQMAAAGMEHVYSNFTIEENCKQFEALYEQQINTPVPKKNGVRFAASLVKSVASALFNSVCRAINKRQAHDHRRHLIVVDPTAFSGGSKVATESILRLLDPQKIRITVVSADKDSWLDSNIQKVALYEPKWLAQQEQGVSYFLRHGFIALTLFITRLRLGRFDIAMGASGPGVDLSLYLLRSLIPFEIVQLIHGPVARSRTIAKCLLAAQQVHYLQSSYASLQGALSALNPHQHEAPAHFHLLQNGLSADRWPSRCQAQKPVIFWAASLLKWKGLDTLLIALQAIPTAERPTTHICYIRPQGVQLPVTSAPITMQGVVWYEKPSNLDEIRASANIFVSTSKHEPFGLSILEAMAAGQCVVIPADGAYWDQILTDHLDCIKYQADNATDLKQKLRMLSNDMSLVAQLGAQATSVAAGYHAEQQYQHIVSSIEHSTDKQSTDNSSDAGK